MVHFWERGSEAAAVDMVVVGVDMVVDIIISSTSFFYVFFF